MKKMAFFWGTYLSHFELFHVGQARLARYPIHFHFDEDFNYRAEKYGEIHPQDSFHPNLIIKIFVFFLSKHSNENEDQSVTSLSIHHANSRFLTIHQTNDVTVRDVVGYNTYGHGFFIEDGVEQNNTFDHNLGILVKPGIILPTDRHHEACIEIGGQETFYTDKDGKRTYEKIQTDSCEMLSGDFSS